MKKDITLETFIREFHSERPCLEFLIDKKWAAGFTCRKCSHKKFVKGKKWHHKRCASCMYDESATAHTLFHKFKFPIESAFTIVYILSTVKKGMSSCEIARQFNIHQETAWFFKRKVQEAMSISPSRKLSLTTQEAGCTYQQADNYSSAATVDDGTCVFGSGLCGVGTV